MAELAENEFQFPTPESTNYAEDIVKNSTIVEEGPRICPLCSSVVRMYYIDFTTKIYMCANAMCEYPFGDNYTVYSSDDDGCAALYGLEFLRIPRNKKFTRSKSTKTSKSTGISSLGMSTLGTNSNLSASEWSDMNPASQGYETDDGSVTSKIFTKKSSQRQIEQKIKKREDEQLIKQNVEMIKECNKVLFDGRGEMGTIRNEKWIKNLSSMQSSSGKRLVKDHELQKLKNTEDNIQLGELKIDIASKKDAMSSIVIEIGNPTAGNKESKKT